MIPPTSTFPCAAGSFPSRARDKHLIDWRRVDFGFAISIRNADIQHMVTRHEYA